MHRAFGAKMRAMPDLPSPDSGAASQLPLAEFTLKAVVAGVVLGIVFGAANAYLGLRVGLTVSASIPAAVMTVALFHLFGRRGTILEANLSQTIGSASTSLASGTIFTIPALFMWGMVPPYLQIVVLCYLGAVLGPFEASLLLRGLRTLHVRVRHQAASAMAMAQHFARDPRIVEVLYPGLSSHPGHATAAAQMTGGFGGMLSVRVKAGEAAAIRAAANVKVWKRATSLGGVESLIEHRASVEGPGTPCPADLLRLSTGLEDPGDLIHDLEQALGSNA